MGVATRQLLPRRAMDAEITVPQMAAILGVSDRTAGRMLDEGLIPFTRPRFHRRMKRGDVLAYKAAQAGNTPVILHETGSDDPLKD